MRHVDADGLFGAPPITAVVGDKAHPTLVKALGLVGFGRRRVLRVPVDGQGRMRADALPELHGPAIVCLQAGKINTGRRSMGDAAVARARRCRPTAAPLTRRPWPRRAVEDCVAARTILYGTHNGLFCWLPPTGHHVAPTITFLYNSYALLSHQPESP